MVPKCGNDGIVVRFKTRDRAENSSHVCPSSPRCINGYLDRASAISRCTLLEKGREIVSPRRLDCRFHKVAQ